MGTATKPATGTPAAQAPRPLLTDTCVEKHSSLQWGNAIDRHYVHSSAQAKPGSSLDSCLSEDSQNPQLRVEALALVLVNDDTAADLLSLTAFGERWGHQRQA